MQLVSLESSSEMPSGDASKSGPWVIPMYDTAYYVWVRI